MANLVLSDVDADTTRFLLLNDYMTSQRCNDFAWKKQYLTYHVTLQETIDSLDRDPWLYIAPIDDTNVFLVIKRKSRVSDQSRGCPRSCLQQNPFETTCQAETKETCSCPCYENIPYNNCENRFQQQNDDTASPCSVSLVGTNQVLYVNSDSVSSPIPPCFLYNCDNMTDAWRCELTGNCEWSDYQCIVKADPSRKSESGSLHLLRCVFRYDEYFCPSRYTTHFGAQDHGLFSYLYKCTPKMQSNFLICMLLLFL